MTFENLNLNPKILKSLSEEGYTNPTPIQEQAIPVILDKTDLVGCAQTGTGKTAAFAIPIINLLQQENDSSAKHKQIKTLIVTPTRELAIQIEDNFKTYGKYTNIRSAVIFGGVNQASQVEKLKKGVDVLIATPGRLLDLYNQKLINLSHLQFLVLDEADQMLDMGFIHDVKKIIKLIPEKRQTLMFSATMPTAIQELAKSFLKNPKYVSVTPISSTAEKVNQKIYFVGKEDKRKLLYHILRNDKLNNVLVFTRTKHGADNVVKFLHKHGVHAAAIHGNKSQNNRQKVLEGFKKKEISVLVATDIAARGIDIEDLPYVINFDLPNISESYVHRIGRTGRAGKSGLAISFCAQDEKSYLKDIEKLISQDIPVISDHPYPWTNGTDEIISMNNNSSVEKKQNSGYPNSRKSTISKENKKRWYRAR